MNQKLFIFDLDGTLVDTAIDVIYVLNNMRKNLGKKELPSKFFLPWLSLGGEDLIINSLEIKIDVQGQLSKFRDLLFLKKTSEARVYSGVKPFLKNLKKSNCNLSICTNKPRFLAEKVLRDTNLIDYFSFMSAGGDIETKKPSPENLQLILDNYSYDKNEVIYVGDSIVDQTICKSLDIPFYFFSKGYNDGVLESRSDFNFEKYEDLLSYLRGKVE